MKSIQNRRTITIILGTVFILVLIYLTYTLIYSRGREDQMIQTRFRALDQMSDNFKTKIDLYKKNAANYTRVLEDSLKKLDARLDELASLNSNIAKRKDFADSIASVQKSIITTINETINNYSKVYNDDFKFIRRNEAESPNPLIFRMDSVIITSGRFEFYLPEEFLLKNIARRDVFSEFMILSDSSIIYNSITGDFRLILMNNGMSGGDNAVTRHDTILLSKEGGFKEMTVQSSMHFDITLADVPYKMFIKSVTIDKHTLFLCGLEKARDFNVERQSIAPGFIIVLSLILLMIILSLPFFKLRLMSKTEQLGAATISNTAVATILGASFLVFFLFFQAYNFSRSKEINRQLQDLSQQLQEDLASEMQHAYGQLYETDTRFLAISRLSREEILNETDILNKQGQWPTGTYPYFDYIFWLDTTGTQTAQITPFSKEEQFISLSSRNYFIKKDKWFWPYPEKGGRNKFYFESIVSVKSGDYKAAISMPSDSNGLVVAMTGRFYSLIDPILPKDFKYCVIDKSGNVLFHSNKFHNLAENLLEECDGSRHLEAALYADVSKCLNVNYYNKPQRIFIEPITGLPLSMVTMYDLKSEQEFQAQVFVTTLILISCIFAYLVFQVIILQLIRRYFGEKARGNPLVEFTRPKKRQDENYRTLILAYAATLVFLVIWAVANPMNNLTTVLAVFSMITILITFTYIHLHNYNWKEPLVKIFLITNTGILLFVTGIFLIAYSTLEEIKYLLFIAILLMILFMAVKRSGPWIRKLKIKTPIAFSLIIFGMVLLFGVLPIIKFFDLAVGLENSIVIRHNQLELLKAREERNAEFSKYYERIYNIAGKEDNPERDMIHSLRKNSGIYTDFWNETNFIKFEKGVSFIPESQIGKGMILAGYADTLLNMFRPAYDNISTENKFLMFDYLPNRSFNWVVTGKRKINLVYVSPSEDITHKELSRVTLQSHFPPSRIYMPFFLSKTGVIPFVKDLFIYSLLLLILVFMFKLIQATCGKIYGKMPAETNDGHGFIHILDQQLKANRRIILVNPSGPVGLAMLPGNIKAHYDKTAEDFTWVGPTGKTDPKTYMVTDLFRFYKDPQKMLTNLHLFNQWLSTEARFIIITETHPDIVLSYYLNKSGAKPASGKGDAPPDAQSAEVYDLLRDILSRINVLPVPVNLLSWARGGREGKLIAEGHLRREESLENVVLEETLSSSYIHGFKRLLEDYAEVLNKLNISETERIDRMIGRITELAGGYYQNLFESCTPEEKFVLLDIAGDAIINHKNEDGVTSLLEKGILARDPDSVVVMNESFRRYLVSIGRKVDRQELKKLLGGDPDNWMGYKIAFVLIILALFVFIFISNQEFLVNMNRLFVTLGASITGISTVVGLLSKARKPA